MPNDLFTNEDYIKFYKGYQRLKDNEYNMLVGCMNRMCVCDTLDELYRMYYAATCDLQKLLCVRLLDFDKRKELGYNTGEKNNE